MESHLEETFRNVAANCMAQRFVVEILLTRYLSEHQSPFRDRLAEQIVQSAKQTDHFAGLTAGNEALSELFADVVVRMQAEVETLVGRAMYQAQKGDMAARGGGQ
jgi:hypothetical protein